MGALFCEPELAGFYRRHGWQAMEGAVTLTGPRERVLVSSGVDPRSVEALATAGRGAGYAPELFEGAETA